MADPERLIKTSASALRALHDTDLRDCPTSTTVAELVEEARLRVDAGVVDPAQFDEAYRRHSPQRLLEVAIRVQPAEPPTPVLVHGRANLSTLRWFPNGTTGWVASDRLGAGDPYRDLATFAIDLATRVSPQALGPFVDAYGIDGDLGRLDFHILLDQLLR